MKISTLIVRFLTPLIWLIFPFRSRGKAALCAEVGGKGHKIGGSTFVKDGATLTDSKITHLILNIR